MLLNANEDIYKEDIFWSEIDFIVMWISVLFFHLHQCFWILEAPTFKWINIPIENHSKKQKKKFNNNKISLSNVCKKRIKNRTERPFFFCIFILFDVNVNWTVYRFIIILEYIKVKNQNGVSHAFYDGWSYM